jgi:hypothetical protein
MHLMYMDLPCPQVGEVDPATGLSIRQQDVILTGLVLYGHSEEHGWFWLWRDKGQTKCGQTKLHSEDAARVLAEIFILKSVGKLAYVRPLRVTDLPPEDKVALNNI